MAEQNRTNLKTYFEIGDRPTQQQFSDLIDSVINKLDDGIIIDDNNNVGIGTSNPSTRLEIVTQDSWNMPPFRIGSDDSNEPAVEFKSGTDTFGIAVNNGATDAFKIHHLATENSLVVDDGGNVGIGTDSPAEKFHVSGNVKIDGNIELQEGVAVHGISNNNTLDENSSEIIPTQQAVKEYVDNLLVGSVAAFAMDVPPEGWLVCDGQELQRAEYMTLFERIGTTFGAANELTFNVPDLMGQFIRGWDGNGAIDPGRQFGSNQLDEFESHNHITFEMHNGSTNDYLGGSAANYGLAINGSGNPFYTDDTGGSETRPTNIALLYCIKY